MTMATSSPTPDTFPKFSLLPTELRRRIWEASLPPRVVEFPHISMERKMAMWEKEICYDPSRPQPKPDTTSLTVLGASYESNNTLNGLYKEMFGFNKPEADDDGIWREYGIQWMRPYKGVRFNPKIDTLHMRTDTCKALMEYGKDGLEPLRFVSVFVADMYELDVQTYIELGFPSVMDLFLNAPNLEMISLVLGSPEYWWEQEQLVIHSDHVAACGIALQDYWDTWRDTEGGEMYSPDDEGRAKARSDRKRWRSIVTVSLPEQSPLYTGPVDTDR